MTKSMRYAQQIIISQAGIMKLGSTFSKFSSYPRSSYPRSSYPRSSYPRLIYPRLIYPSVYTWIGFWYVCCQESDCQECTWEGLIKSPCFVEGFNQKSSQGIQLKVNRIWHHHWLLTFLLNPAQQSPLRSVTSWVRHDWFVADVILLKKSSPL